MLPWLEDPWNDFAARLEQGRMPHALLVTGAAGTGKGELAQAMLRGLLCEGDSAEACGECRSCKLLAGGAHPDRFILTPEEGKSLIPVDHVRELIGRLMLTTTISQRKVALLTPAEAMNNAAANALLKTLEEPPGDTVLVLVSHDPSRLPATIRSRCQVLAVNLPTPEAAVTWLREGAGLDEDAARRALEATAGRPLMAAALAGEGGLERYSELRRSLAAIIGKPSQAAGLAAELQDIDPTMLWSWLSTAAGRAMASVLGGTAETWPVTDYTLPPDRLARLQLRADENRRLMGTPVRKDLLLQEWLIEWARLPAREPIR